MRLHGIHPTVIAALALPVVAFGDARLDPYVDALEAHGADPVDFVAERLEETDLVLFDDALHPAVEPFVFYEALVRDPRVNARLRFVFIETIPVSEQRCLDAYLDAPTEDPTLLYPALQNDTSGMGSALESYLHFFRTVHEVNATLPEERRMRLVAVSTPTYWCNIETREDVEHYRSALLGRDYDMYRMILARMEDFEAGYRGIFLTNTRHAYTGVRKRSGEAYWNTGTFFRQHHPGRTLSVRIHNITLFIRAIDPSPEAPRTFHGTERLDYGWVRVGHGIWDTAFAMHGRPVALEIRGTAFGAEPYIGNHMLDVEEGTTMADAYDAVVYLAPYESMRLSASSDAIYTPEFRQELARRYRLLRTPAELRAEMEAAGVGDIAGLIERLAVSRPERPLPEVGPIDEWRGE